MRIYRMLAAAGGKNIPRVECAFMPEVNRCSARYCRKIVLWISRSGPWSVTDPTGRLVFMNVWKVRDPVRSDSLDR